LAPPSPAVRKVISVLAASRTKRPSISACLTERELLLCLGDAWRSGVSATKWTLEDGTDWDGGVPALDRAASAEFGEEAERLAEFHA